MENTKNEQVDKNSQKKKRNNRSKKKPQSPSTTTALLNKDNKLNETSASLIVINTNIVVPVAGVVVNSNNNLTPKTNTNKRHRKKKSNNITPAVEQIANQKLNITEEIVEIMPSSKKSESPPKADVAKLQKTTETLPTSTTTMSSTKLATELNTTKEVKQTVTAQVDSGDNVKTREQILAERELKKLAKLAKKGKTTTVDEKIVAATGSSIKVDDITKNIAKLNLAQQEAIKLNVVTTKQEEQIKTIKPTLTKAERRAIQEAQRAAKSTGTTTVSVGEKNKSNNLVSSTIDASKSTSSKDKSTTPLKKIISTPLSTTTTTTTTAATTLSTTTVPKSKEHRVKLFSHLYLDRQIPINILNSQKIHPAMVRLGVQYATGTVTGSNVRTIAFMNAMKMLINDYETPQEKEFARSLEVAITTNVNYLGQCRPLSVSIINALKFIKLQITHLPSDETDDELKLQLNESIDTYLRDQIEKAAEAICYSVQQKICDGDVILIYGGSSLILRILIEAQKRNVDFHVIVVDARPHHEGQEMLCRLVKANIRCTVVLINALGYVMKEVKMVLLTAHALLSNGYVVSRAGTSQVALVAKAFSKPVLVCSEIHKFSDRVQTDAFVHNEIGDPSELQLKSGSGKPVGALTDWESLPHLTPLNLCYDLTPPELVTAVVTELSVLPCSSVPVILRIQPS